tara:strand:- start:1214 stop:1468 length:255 start_codon:yes stop_codon:yes gene_type:complete
MEELTNTEIAKLFANAGDSVTLINGTKPDWETEEEWKDEVKRNVEHLETIKAIKKLDRTTSVWTTEDFTDIDKAIVDGKKVYGG